MRPIFQINRELTPDEKKLYSICIDIIIGREVKFGEEFEVELEEFKELSNKNGREIGVVLRNLANKDYIKLKNKNEQVNGKKKISKLIIVT